MRLKLGRPDLSRAGPGRAGINRLAAVLAGTHPCEYCPGWPIGTA